MKSPILFGASGLGRHTVAQLRAVGIEPVCFVDNDPTRWQTKFEGIDVMSLAAAVERYGYLPIVVTIHSGNSVATWLRSKGFSVLSFVQVALMYPDVFLPFMAYDSPEKMKEAEERISHARALWEDEESRREYDAQIALRCDAPIKIIPPHLPMRDMYFPADLVTLREEYYVDCGAYNGDSVDAFLRRSGGWFRGIMAIEPDPLNFHALRRYVASLPMDIHSRINLVDNAVGATVGKMRFNAHGTVASNLASDGNSEIWCSTLDELLDGMEPTFIKMDLEGGEVNAIDGSRYTLRRHAPKLAICLYHRQSDVWEIPLLVHSITDRYKFYLRRYAEDVWETVMYAVPK